ncbi:DinB family protein [Brevibacillus fluminis]|uniref:DinB family protein n=1 Tax=Brevibacillus fluminis TaxID=511487 RepID=A0A3M8DIK0_9BACL|nr:DinB family protein [Brevibacillus fluminis]RNB87419.1 DinB family protein [Brevibacillus fluminis]
MNQRPAAEDHSAYYGQYIGLVPDGEISEILVDQHEEMTRFLSELTEEQASHRYEEGKWSIKEVIGHIADTERVMCYRLLRIARGDQTALPGFDQDLFMEGISFDAYSVADLLEDYSAVRRATLTLLRGLPAEAWDRKGVVSDNNTTANALAYVIAGHELHHMNIIKERYL